MSGHIIYDYVSESDTLLSNAEIQALPHRKYAEFHRATGDYYLGIRARAVTWDGKDSFIMYISDESKEHQKRLEQEALLNLVPVGIGIYVIEDGILKQVYMNDRYYLMIGEPREKRKKNVREGFLKFVYPDDMAVVNAVVKKIAAGSNEETLDHRILCGNGKYVWFRLVASVSKRVNDKVILYCSYANIDDTYAAQEALKNANTVLKKQYDHEMAQREMLERDILIAVQFNVTQDKLVSYRVNKELALKYEDGTKGTEIRPSLFNEAPTEEEQNIIADFFSRDRAVERYDQGVKEFSAEYRRRMKDGRLYWIHSTCKLAPDENGDLISYTYCRNIDMEKKKELVAYSVIDEDTDFVMLLNLVANKVMLIRKSGEYQDSPWILNREFKFDKEPKDSSLETVEPADRAMVYDFFVEDKLIERLKSAPLVQVIYRYRGPDGELRRKKIRAFYLDDLREDIVIARRDITDIYEEEQEQKQALQTALEEARRANNAKSEFLSRMSHDLRTPMNVIIGLTAMALEELDQTEEMKGMLANISSSAQYLLSLINDCLDMEKITSGKIELHPEVYLNTDFYNSVRAVIVPLCKQKNITFIIDNKNDASPAIMVDKVRIEQIFYNLLSNAVKFTPEGGTVEMLIRNQTVEDGYTSYDSIVRDNGIGMSEEFQRHMFETFTQETNSVTPEYTGSGLGLAIVKQLVELMGGTISVKSSPGKGTEVTVHFRLPLAKETEKAVALPKPIVMDQLKGKRILLVEDHPLNSLIAEKILEKNGIIVSTASNGQEALDRFVSSEEGFFDGVLMDIRMPVMDGLEATRAIRASDKADAKAIPIIAMTANAFDVDVQKSLDAGMNAHISKPIDAKILYDTLAEFIKS